MRRLAQTLLALGALLLAMTAVAFAQDPTPTPSPTPEPTATATPTATPEATPAPPEPTPSPPEPTATPSATPSPVPAPSASPSPTPAPVQGEATPSARPRQAPTPPPDPTPTPPDQFTGASLTLCHWTGAEYVPVTITADQYSGYFDMPLDVIPAPASGCAGIDPATAANQEVTVCHRNADGSFTLLRYPPGDLGGHEGDVGDLIPAPAGTCPGVAPGTVAVTPTPSPSPAPTAAATEPPADGDVVAEATASPTRTPIPTGDIKARVVAVTGPAAAPAPAPAVTAQQLPFTGLDLGLIAALGLGLVLCGAGLRLLAQPPVGVTR